MTEILKDSVQSKSIWTINPPANAGDVGSFPGSGRSPREGNGNPLQYSCLENPMNRGARRATVHGATKVWDMNNNSKSECLNNNGKSRSEIRVESRLIPRFAA